MLGCHSLFPPSIPGAATDIELVVTAIALNIRVDIWNLSRPPRMSPPPPAEMCLPVSAPSDFACTAAAASERLAVVRIQLLPADDSAIQTEFDLTAIRELGDEFLIEFRLNLSWFSFEADVHDIFPLAVFFGFASHSKTGWLDFWVGIQAFVSTPHSSNSTVGMQTQFARFSFLLSYCPNLKYRIPASESKAVLRFWLEFELMNAESDPEFIEISTEKRGPQGVDTLRLWEYNLKSHLCAIQLPGFQQIFAFQWPFDLKIKCVPVSYYWKKLELVLVTHDASKPWEFKLNLRASQLLPESQTDESCPGPRIRCRGARAEDRRHLRAWEFKFKSDFCAIQLHGFPCKVGVVLILWLNFKPTHAESDFEFIEGSKAQAEIIVTKNTYTCMDWNSSRARARRDSNMSSCLSFTKSWGEARNVSSEAVDLHGQLDSDRENVFGQRPSRCTRLPTCAGPRWHAALVDERIRPHVRFVAAFACSAGRAPRELA
ncbi:hypothetical protein C8R45DRAFT_1098083 [Mycena sanguinolenta]|nr:hypothetical protein C8R45DRAFT_1098083 [Mycena sanguinolenta]